MKKQYVVRVVLHRDDPPPLPNAMTDGIGLLLESLRYAQLVTVHRDDESSCCFDLRCPKGLDSKPWSEMNANRMRSFGYNAVSAPSTEPVRQDIHIGECGGGHP